MKIPFFGEPIYKNAFLIEKLKLFLYNVILKEQNLKFLPQINAENHKIINRNIKFEIE